jgi:hypothetical protein
LEGVSSSEFALLCAWLAQSRDADRERGKKKRECRQRDPQAYKTLPKKLSRPLAGKGRRCEIPRQKEKEPHRKRLIHGREERKDKLCDRSQRVISDLVAEPAAIRPVGDGAVVQNHAGDEQDPDVVEKTDRKFNSEGKELLAMSKDNQMRFLLFLT